MVSREAFIRLCIPANDEVNRSLLALILADVELKRSTASKMYETLKATLLLPLYLFIDPVSLITQLQ